MARGRGGAHHVGRRKKANIRRNARERDEMQAAAAEDAARRAQLEAKKKEIQVSQHGALSRRGLLGLGLRDQLVSGRGPSHTHTHAHTHADGSDDDDDGRGGASAYDKLLGWFPGKKRRAAATPKYEDEEELGDDAVVVPVSTHTRTHTHAGAPSKKGREVQYAHPGKRGRGLGSDDEEGSDDDEADEEEFAGDTEADAEDDDEEDAAAGIHDDDDEEGEEDESEDGDEGEEEEEAEDESEDGDNEDEDDDENASDSGDASDADADAASDDAEAKDGHDDGRERNDIFLRRFMQTNLDEKTCVQLAQSMRTYASVDAFTLPVSACGVGWDTVTALTMTASCPTKPDALTGGSALGFCGALDAAYMKKAFPQPAKDDTALPPAADLINAYAAKAKVATAWNATYGSESHRALLKFLKSQLRRQQREKAASAAHLAEAHEHALHAQHPFTPLQWTLWEPMNSYRDVYFAARTHANARELRSITALHVINHVVKARELVQKHEARMRERAIRARVARLSKAHGGAAAGPSAAAEPEPEYRDQGFTRPRVLMLLPTRHAALQYVRSMLRLLPGRQIMNRNRFFKEFTEEDSGLGAEWEDDDDAEAAADAAAAAASSGALASISRRERQMMSDLEDSDNDSSDDEAAVTGAGKSSHYIYNQYRQGWSDNLRKKYLQQKRSGGGSGDESADDGEVGDARDDSATDNDTDASGAKDAVPLSALATTAGRDKTDHRIVKSSKQQLVFRGRRQRMKKSADSKKAQRKQRRAANARPRDYELTFAGNIDDDFRVGIALSRKSVKLYADFYDADIIVSSPLGLRRIIGAEGEKTRDVDFLSSIEVLVLDSTDVLLQQNWQHVRDVMAVVNGIPKDPKHTDFSRVREWNLGGLAKYYRQTICLSAIMETDINALMRHHCFNMNGGVVVRGTYAGTITRVLPTVRQVFQRVSAPSAAAADDARFEHFREKVLPELIAGVAEDAGELLAHTLIYIPSYMDYVRIRNLMDKHEVEFVTCSEYSEDKDITRARAHFYQSLSPIMLLTERFHFFRRYQIRGARHIIFYAPPTIPWFYDEFVNMLSEASAAGHAISVSVLFTRWDVHALTRVCGETHAAAMTRPDNKGKDTFYFI